MFQSLLVILSINFTGQICNWHQLWVTFLYTNIYITETMDVAELKHSVFHMILINVRLSNLQPKIIAKLPRDSWEKDFPSSALVSETQLYTYTRCSDFKCWDACLGMQSMSVGQTIERLCQTEWDVLGGFPPLDPHLDSPSACYDTN